MSIRGSDTADIEMDLSYQCSVSLNM